MRGIDKIQEFLAEWPIAEWGPAHVVLSDHNLEVEFIDSCLKGLEFAIRQIESGVNQHPTHSVDELRATTQILDELRAMDEDDRFAGTHLDESEQDA